MSYMPYISHVILIYIIRIYTAEISPPELPGSAQNRAKRAESVSDSGADLGWTTKRDSMSIRVERQLSHLGQNPPRATTTIPSSASPAGGNGSGGQNSTALFSPPDSVSCIQELCVEVKACGSGHATPAHSNLLQDLAARFITPVRKRVRV